MDRRQFLATGSAAFVLPIVPGAALAASTAPGDASLNAAFDRIFAETIRNSPQQATALGLDKGANASLRATLDAKPFPQARAEQVARDRAGLAAIRAISPATLSPAAALNREIVIYDLETSLTAPTRFGIDSVQSPYPITQQNGAYFDIPDFLDSSHPVENASDAEAYCSRLSEFARLLDFETQEQRRMAARGFLAPGWSLDLALGQMLKLRQQPAEQNGLVRSLTGRAAKAGIAGDWAGRATRIVANEVYPALDRQIAAIRALRPRTLPGDGATRLSNGAAIYAAALAQATTTAMTPDEVHQLGLSQVAEYSGQLDALLKANGYSNGTVGARLAALSVAPDQLYPNTDAGRAQLIADLNSGIRSMTPRLPKAFSTLPGQPLEIRRVPPDIQDGAPNGYYYRASLDGARPAIYWINLKNTSDWPRYTLPSLTYHEGLPGHHLQISLTQESGEIPMLRKISHYSSYIEGWGLYAEQLADELGGYTGIEKAGYLQSFLFRSTRLVVDTGLNAKGWSRERAVAYMIETTGFPRGRVEREVERYCASIGQACSYKVGHLAWLRARAKAKAALGAKFDIRQFHEVLKDGAMPLTILERRIAERTRMQMGA